MHSPFPCCPGLTRRWAEGPANSKTLACALSGALASAPFETWAFAKAPFPKFAGPSAHRRVRSLFTTNYYTILLLQGGSYTSFYPPPGSLGQQNLDSRAIPERSLSDPRGWIDVWNISKTTCFTIKNCIFCSGVGCHARQAPPTHQKRNTYYTFCFFENIGSCMSY